jgi:hypothetical protein
MKRKITLVRISGIVTGTFLLSLFVHLYGMLQANWLQYGLKINQQCLPLPTYFYAHYSFLGYLLPLAASIVFRMRRDDDESQQLFIHVYLWVIGVCALAWLLTSILAWQLPVYYPVTTIE